MSNTRWSAQIESVRPVAAHLPGILSALEDLEKQLKYDQISRGLKHMLMASIWVKVLTAIDYRYKVLQARSATLMLNLITYKVLLRI